MRIAKGGFFSKGNKKKLEEQLKAEEEIQGKKEYYPGRLVITIDALIIRKDRFASAGG